jgi:hypothetical protein
MTQTSMCISLKESVKLSITNKQFLSIPVMRNYDSSEVSKHTLAVAFRGDESLSDVSVAKALCRVSSVNVDATEARSWLGWRFGGGSIG